MQYTGAQILIEALIEQGVDTVFGYPGGAVLFIYDELYKNKDRIRHILVSHEQHAAHAADGYARSTGKVGVCIATSGPGATNLVTGIATAYMDSVPLVAITGNVTTNLLGKDSFQEVDIAGITMPVVKHNWIVKDVSQLEEIIREAFIVARSGRPGPVLIDIPKDITANTAEWHSKSQLDGADSSVAQRAKRLSERNTRKTFSANDIEKTVLMLNEAKFPMIYAGGGVIISDACAELQNFAEKISSPVALSLMAQGALSHEHPLCTGMIGMHGTVASNKAVQKSDLLIAIGARFSDRVMSRADRFAKNAKILQLDIDPAEINKNISTAFSVVGDIKLILKKVMEKLAPQPPKTAWISEVEAWKKKVPKANYRAAALHPRFIVEETAKILGMETIAVTDVGQHQMWAAQFFPFCKPRTFLSSGGLGTMGYGLGAALGAKTANPKKPVVLFTGDGSFRMNCAELGTLVFYKMPVLVIIFNNNVLGMVRQWQNLFHGKRYSQTILERPPDFVKLAGAYGVSGYSADSEASFLEALKSAAADNAKGITALIDAHIDMDEMVLPMVPGGKPIDEQIL